MVYLTNRLKNKNYTTAIAPILIAFSAFFLSIPLLYLSLQNGVDDSWVYGLHKAKQNGLITGKDIFFTYGPLGYLMFPVYIDRALWAYSAIFTTFIHLALFVVVFLFLRKNEKISLPDFVLVFAVLTIVLQFDVESKHYIYLLIAAYMYLAAGKNDYRILIPVMFGFSVFFYFKFSYGISLFCTFLAFEAILLKERRFQDFAVSVIIYCVFIFVQGLILIGSPSELLTFFRNSVEISSGYNAAMALYGSLTEIYISLFILIFYFSLLAYFVVKKNKQPAIFLILSAGAFFFLFKHGVVRQRFEHVAGFWGSAAILFSLFYVSQKRTLNIYLKSFLFFFIFFLALGSFYLNAKNTTKSIAGYPMLKTRRIVLPLRFIFDELRGIKIDIKKLNKNSLSKFFYLSPQTIGIINGHSVDIYPFHIIMAELYGFKWSPRPIFQSYSAYTVLLDSLNEKQLRTPQAPQFILYSTGSIDEKNSFFYEPKTFRTIMTEYEIVSIDGDFILFAKKQKPDVLKEKKLFKKETEMNSAVTLSKLNFAGLNFAGITVNYNLIGRIIMLVFKAPPVYIHLKNNTEAFTYRLTISNSQSGLLLNPYIGEGGEISISINSPYPSLFQKQTVIEVFKLEK
ncbi:MAG: hypothetical protein H7844_06905 [Nitrospirae bacterium YQR-1]